jgi:DNA transformation protein
VKPTRSLRSAASFERFVLDQLSDLGEVSSRKMFGGVGLYGDGVFFGIIARDALYLKVDARTRGAYERAGMLPFMPFPGRPTSMGYYEVPVEVLESGMELARWARDAVKVAMRARAGRRRGSA